MRCTKGWSWIARGLVLASCLELGCAEPPQTRTSEVHEVHAFALAAPAPSITSFSPMSGAQGTVVTLQGNNFDVGSTVAFNGTLATAVTRSSSRLLLATVPPLATSGPIRVSHPGGSASSARPFAVLPAITSVTPLEAFPGDHLSVLGTGFTGTTAVRMGRLVAPFQRLSDTRLDVTVPAGAETAQLQVEKPSGVATSAQTVTVLPVLSGMSPTRGSVGSVVRLTGAGFTRVTTVRLGRLTAAFVLVDDRNLDATVPAAAVSAQWEVIAPTSSARSRAAFAVIPTPLAPVVVSFSPASSALPARVVLTGTGFTDVTSVTLAGLPLPFTQGSARTLTVDVPLGATSGGFAVTNPGGTGTSRSDFVVIDRCTGVVCAAIDTCHVAGTCDPLTGACSAPIAADGTPCDDGLLCTVGDACLFGACGGEPVVCAARDACHVAGVCDPATGACSDPPAADGTACDDHDACTLRDACVAGACAGDSRPACAAADQCRAAGACNPLSGACTGAALPEGTACDDGEPSTTQDACTAGVCSGEVPAAGDVVQAEVEAGDTITTDSGDGATPRDAVETAVQSPLDGLVSIAEVEPTTAPPPGFAFLEHEVQIEAPVASSGMPLVLTFTLDSSLLPRAVTVGTLQVFRNGVLVPACAGAPGTADPDPCVSERATIGDDAVITVLTSQASEWNFGYLDLVSGKLATGKSHTCAIREEGLSGGRVYCWGSNKEGQLGNAAAGQSSPSPVLVSTMGDAIRVTAGHNHTCVLRDDGTVWCWGRGEEGQLGTSATSAPLPVRAGSFSDAVDVAAGSNHTCAVLASGSVECWGANAKGQLGNGAGANSATPLAVPGVTGALQVTGGSEHGCALYEHSVDGVPRTAVMCWGNGSVLGDGISTPLTPRQPVVVSGLNDVSALSAGTLHTCALRHDRTVACWGSGSQGQLGCGGNSLCLSPMSVDVTNAVQIAAGNQHTCALKADGEVSCWGDGSSGERGDDSPVTPALLPVPTLDLIGVKHLSAGFARTCALRSDGTVRCWGATTNDGTNANALGTGTTELASTPVATSGVGAAAELTSGLEHSCVRVGGGIRCWGSRDQGELGDGYVAPKIAATPVTVLDAGGLPFADAAQLAAGGQHSCVLRTAGTVACFGSRSNGQLGDGQVADETAMPPIPEAALSPVAVSSLTAGGTPDSTTGLPDVATQLAAGNLHTCAVLSQSGKVVCWGAGSDGQLGHGSIAAKVPAPVPVLGLSTRATQVAAGWFHSCARLEDGRVACWGQARNGQLGHGATTPILTPVTSALDALDRATQVATGRMHTCALLETKTVKCWGSNGNGQLGIGTTALEDSPVQVVGLSDVVQVTASDKHTCALVEGGTVKCWGYGRDGQLGNGSTLDSLLPVDVVGLADVVQLAAGSQHTCARRAGGSVSCWGSGKLGQRGDNYPYAAKPLPVPQLAPFGKCMDDDLCNGSESHDLYGACIEGTPLVVDDDNACTSDFCDPPLGVQHVAVADGSACNDGNACTQSDACTAGACTGDSPVVCAPPDACHGAGVCNSGTGACEYAALPDGTTCATAADACTDASTCVFGVCMDGAPITCDDGDACTTDGCNPFTGCTTAPLACDDANACTADGCNPLLGCTITLLACDDANACTADSCDALAGCGHAAVSCDDGNVCTDDSCEASLGCQYSNNTAACTDGDPCTETEHCLGGACTDGVATDCSHADDPCNTGVCDPSDGSCDPMPLADTTLCGDGNSCTSGDHCMAGSCVAGPDNACGPHAIGCTPGTPNLCVCELAYVDDGGTCVPSTDECAGGCGAAACDVNSTCSDPSSTCGDRVCTCNVGYSDADPSDEATCLDIDACAGDPCGAGLCTDEAGLDYSCTCIEGFASVDAIHDGVNNPTCVCDMDGTFAIRIRTDLSWSGLLGLDDGDETTYAWAIRVHDYDAHGVLSVSTTHCGSTTPDRCGSGGAFPGLGPEAYAQFLTNQIWGQPGMPVELVTMNLPAPRPGAAFVAQQSAVLLGIHLNDPMGAWPNVRTQVGPGPGAPGSVNGAFWVNHDGDTSAAVTTYMVPPGGLLPDGVVPDPPCADIGGASPTCFEGSGYGALSTVCPRDGGARLAYAYLPGLDGGFTVRRVKRFFGAARVISGLNGTFESCDRISGDVTGPAPDSPSDPGGHGEMHVDDRIHGCVRTEGSGEAACSLVLTDFYDTEARTQNVNDASFIIQRVPGNVTCSEVRAMDFD